MKFLQNLLLFLLFIISKFAYSQNSNVDLKDLIRPDFGKEEYWEFTYIMKDTITSTGWEIKYFVKNDDTRFDDVYILCQKNGVRRIYKIPHVLKGRVYFVPYFSHETEFCIYFEHGCATSCRAVLAFSKRNQNFQDFPDIVKMDLKLDLIVRVTDYGRKEYRKLFELELIDLARNKNYILSYENLCRAASYKNICIEEIKFFYNKVIITTILSHPISTPENWEEELKETRVIELK